VRAKFGKRAHIIYVEPSIAIVARVTATFFASNHGSSARCFLIAFLGQRARKCVRSRDKPAGDIVAATRPGSKACCGAISVEMAA
jgi:hypothetical protein